MSAFVRGGLILKIKIIITQINDLIDSYASEIWINTYDLKESFKYFKKSN